MKYSTMKQLPLLSMTIVFLATLTLQAKDRDTRSDERMTAIEFLEIEENIEADVDLVKYLPDGFDPYKGMIVDPATVHFENVEAPITLEFDTTPYLPKNFNPYRGM